MQQLPGVSSRGTSARQSQGLSGLGSGWGTRLPTVMRRAGSLLLKLDISSVVQIEEDVSSSSTEAPGTLWSVEDLWGPRLRGPCGSCCPSQEHVTWPLRDPVLPSDVRKRISSAANPGHSRQPRGRGRRDSLHLFRDAGPLTLTAGTGTVSSGRVGVGRGCTGQICPPFIPPEAFGFHAPHECESLSPFISGQPWVQANGRPPSPQHHPGLPGSPGTPDFPSVQLLCNKINPI